MKCLNPDCGEEIPEEALFCPFCETKKVAEIELSATDASMFEYEYDSESGGMVIKTYLGNSSMVIIPGELDGKPVVAVGNEAFAYNTRLTNVTIPDSVTQIGDLAFVDCASLAKITIPNKITTIPLRAFKGCKSLTSVTIPNSVVEIDRYAFYECTSLTTITIPDNVTKCYGAFGGCKNIKAADKGKTYNYKKIEKLYKAINNY